MTPLTILEQIGLRPDIGAREDLGPTRDRQDVRAYRDVSGVVYLSEDVGVDYGAQPPPAVSMQMVRDDRRRERQFELGDSWLDFGCGRGGLVVSAAGVGMDPCWEYDRDGGRQWGCYARLEDTPYPFQVVTAFHVVEHLPDPVGTLRELAGYMADGARLIVEVPHARDWLLENCEAFQRFTLWSQHLILHTRESLSALLRTAGFAVDRIEGFQRYPHSNAIHWLTHGKPGCFDVDERLDAAWAATLSRQDKTDTIIVWATKQ